MADYGHELKFGSFLTPANHNPAGVVGLAEHSEEVGLDLVTFQDHPYQPSFLDTWTLMSFIAARTQEVTIAPNVLNLPLRKPAVIARAVASLDRLSRGRIELGLGAGAFWDAMVAMGATRLTPGESVTSLAESIRIIRELWDTGNPERLEINGEHHQISGAKRGPAPSHDVKIWLGGYRPRMLGLVGTISDGWLPSMAYFKNGVADLADGNARIDEAALGAGRQPGAIRRLLNIGGSFTDDRSAALLKGPAQQWAEQIADLALGFGVGTFILGSDDAHELSVFGNEVAPAARQIVATERG